MFGDAGWQVSVEYIEESSQIAIRFPNNDLYHLTPIEKEGAAHFIHGDTGVEASFKNNDGKLEIFLYNQTGVRQ